MSPGWGGSDCDGWTMAAEIGRSPASLHTEDALATTFVRVSKDRLPNALATAQDGQNHCGSESLLHVADNENAAEILEADVGQARAPSHLNKSRRAAEEHGPFFRSTPSPPLASAQCHRLLIKCARRF
jgi:hypothetical protein